jgi:hypothetical protein
MSIAPEREKNSLVRNVSRSVPVVRRRAGIESDPALQKEVIKRWPMRDLISESPHEIAAVSADYLRSHYVEAKALRMREAGNKEGVIREFS